MPRKKYQVGNLKLFRATGILQRIMGKLLDSKEDLLALIADSRKQGKTIVTTNGCFDLLHRGHLHILRQARSQGDVVIVGLNSDHSVRLNKGNSRPIMPDKERAELLCAFEMVDYVYLFDEKDSTDFVRLVGPEVHVNDASYGENCIESGAVRDCGGRLHMVSKIEGPSTTALIAKVRESFKS